MTSAEYLAAVDYVHTSSPHVRIGCTDAAHEQYTRTSSSHSGRSGGVESTTLTTGVSLDSLRLMMRTAMGASVRMKRPPIISPRTVSSAADDYSYSYDAYAGSGSSTAHEDMDMSEAVLFNEGAVLAELGSKYLGNAGDDNNNYYDDDGVGGCHTTPHISHDSGDSTHYSSSGGGYHALQLRGNGIVDDISGSSMFVIDGQDADGSGRRVLVELTACGDPELHVGPRVFDAATGSLAGRGRAVTPAGCGAPAACPWICTATYQTSLTGRVPLARPFRPWSGAGCCPTAASTVAWSR